MRQEIVRELRIAICVAIAITNRSQAQLIWAIACKHQTEDYFQRQVVIDGVCSVEVNRIVNSEMLAYILAHVILYHFKSNTVRSMQLRADFVPRVVSDLIL